MNQFTTKQLLQILPMSEDIRKNILEKYDSLTEDQKLEINKICWLMFFELYNDKTQQEFQKTLSDFKNSKRPLKNTLYQDIGNDVYMELRKILLEKSEKETVDKVRDELQKQLN